MNDEYKITASHVSKAFKMYDTPMDKLKEAFSVRKKEFHTVFYAVSDLSFRVKKGEILGIMGRNGSGKSTLLKMIAGIYEPTDGKITVSGKISSLLELGMGFNMEYTGIENIFFYGTLMGYTKSEMENRLQMIVDFAEIGDYVYQPVKNYSSGMFARLAFSCAVHVEPDILIVDEILSVGDLRFQAKCFRKFKEFKDAGTTILYVGHDVSTMRIFCDTAMWIDKGRLVDVGDPAFISAEYTEYMYTEDLTDFTSYKLRSRKGRKEPENQSAMEKDAAAESQDIKGQDTLEKNKASENQDELKKCKALKSQEKLGGCEASITQDTEIKESLFPDSIAHWGTSMGMIQSVELYDDKREGRSVFRADERMRVEIVYMADETVDPRYLSVSFSIKNTKGTDIIVKTTYDENKKLHSGGEFTVSFDLVSGLADGDYYVAAALEDRREASIRYYEYIEGACYFKMCTPKRIFGVYDVIAEIGVSQR